MKLKLILAALLLAPLLACGDDGGSGTTTPEPTPDAGADVEGDTTPEPDAEDDKGSPAETRRLVDYDPFEGAGNMVYVPDFDMSVFTQKWINLTPAIDARGPDMVKEERWSTPSGRTQVLRLPGTAEAPSGSLLMAPTAVADGPTHAEMWVGVRGAHPPEGASIQMVGVTAADGQVFADLTLNEASMTENDGITWARYEATLPPYLGAAGFHITNTGIAPIRLNGPWVGER